MKYSKVLDANNLPIHERDTVGASLEMTWAFDNFDLMSITSYSDTDSQRLTDVDGTQLWVIYTDRPETFEVFTQELRLVSTSDSDLQWMMGLYMEDIETTMRSTLDLGWLLLGAEEFLHVAVPFETRDEDDSKIAAFGNITYTWVTGNLASVCELTDGRPKKRCRHRPFGFKV